MGHIDHPRRQHAAFPDTLRAVAEVVQRLPYGIPEPVLCGASAMSLYTFGLWPCADLELSATEPDGLTAALTAEGFRHDDNARPADGRLRRSDLRCAVRIAADPLGHSRAVSTNVVRVALDPGDASIFGTSRSSLDVIGIEDFIADYIAARRRQGVRIGEAGAFIQVLIELGQMGVGGLFRHACLQRRLHRETDGEVVFEIPHTVSQLDNLSSRRTSLSAIGRVVCDWRRQRGLSTNVDHSAVADTSAHVPIHVDRRRNDQAEREGRSAPLKARIIPFPLRQPIRLTDT